MSTSVREADRGRSSDEPLNYAPKRLRLANPDATAVTVPPPPVSQKEVVPRGAVEDAAPVQPAEPPWRRSSRQRGVFAGDVAIADLRARLALAPDRLPEPPPPTPRDMTLVWAGRLAGAAIVVAVGLAGYRWGASPTAFRFQFPHARHARVAPNPSPGGGQLAATVRPPPAARLNVAAPAALSANDAAPLDVSASGLGAGAAVLIGGLASGTTLSAGEEVAPDAWRLSAAELAGAVLTPPRDFAGDMELTLELRLADNVLADRKIMRLQWREGELAARRAPARHHDRTDIAEMVRRGGELMANGDVSAARLLYQRAAEAGEAAAAFSLAETYDPLAPKGEAGAAGADPALARFWYKKASDLGSDEAGGRIERLGRINPAE